MKHTAKHSTRFTRFAKHHARLVMVIHSRYFKLAVVATLFLTAILIREPKFTVTVLISRVIDAFGDVAADRTFVDEE